MQHWPEIPGFSNALSGRQVHTAWSTLTADRCMRQKKTRDEATKDFEADGDEYFLQHKLDQYFLFLPECFA